ALGPDPGRLALDAVRQRLADAFEGEPLARGDDPHVVAGGEPLARSQMRLAQRLAGPDRLGERSTDDDLAIEEGGRELLGEVDLGLVEIALGDDAARRGTGTGDEGAAPDLDDDRQVDVPRGPP